MKAAKQANQTTESARRGSFIQRQCDHCAEEQEEETPFISSSRVGKLQTKLAVGAPNDIYEQEADRIADQVMAMPAHDTIRKSPIHVQRVTEAPSGQTTEAPASVERALSNPGQPLAPRLREEMEGRFGGHDFSGVRIHTGQEAEQSARDVGANAYTVGRNIIFGQNFFSPLNFVGQHLLAHELTHVLQQNDSRINLTDDAGTHVLQGNRRRRSGRRSRRLSPEERRFLHMRFSNVRTEIIHLRDYLHIARSSRRQGILALNRFLRFSSEQTVAIDEHWNEIVSVPLIDSIRNVLGERYAQAARDEINGARIRVGRHAARRARAGTAERDRQFQTDVLRISQNQLDNPSFPLAQMLSGLFSGSSPEQQAAIRHLLYFVVEQRSRGNHRGLTPGVKYTQTGVFEGYYLGEYLRGYYWLRENLNVFRESGRDELIEAFRVGTLRAREMVRIGNIVQLFGMGVLGGAIVGGGLIGGMVVAGGITLLDSTGREIEERHYHPEHAVDWSEIAFETFIAVVTAGFGGWIASKIVGGLVSRFPSLASSTGQMLTEAGVSFLQDQVSNLFHAAARAVFDHLRGEPARWETVAEFLADNLAESLSADQIFLSGLGAFLGLSGPDLHHLLAGGSPTHITPSEGSSEASARPPTADVVRELDFQRLDAEFAREISEGIEEFGEPPFERDASADANHPEGDSASSTVSQSQEGAAVGGGIHPIVDFPRGPGHLTVEDRTCQFCVNPCAQFADFLERTVARIDLNQTTRGGLENLIRDVRAHHEAGSPVTRTLLEGFRNRLDLLASDSQLNEFLRDRQQLLDLLTDIEATSTVDRDDAHRYSDDENPNIDEEVIGSDPASRDLNQQLLVATEERAERLRETQVAEIATRVRELDRQIEDLEGRMRDVNRRGRERFGTDLWSTWVRRQRPGETPRVSDEFAATLLSERGELLEQLDDALGARRLYQRDHRLLTEITISRERYIRLSRRMLYAPNYIEAKRQKNTGERVDEVFDTGREYSLEVDHLISRDAILSDERVAGLPDNEIVAIADSLRNLIVMPQEANQSKGERSVNEWGGWGPLSIQLRWESIYRPRLLQRESSAQREIDLAIEVARRRYSLGR